MEDAKREVQEMMAEIRARMEQAQLVCDSEKDHTAKFLRSVDHKVDLDLLHPKFTPTLPVALPSASRIAANTGDFQGIYNLEISDPPTYRNKSATHTFTFAVEEGYWKLLERGETCIARCADSVHLHAPDKLGGRACPFETVQKAPHGLVWTFDFSIQVDKISF